MLNIMRIYYIGNIPKIMIYIFMDHWICLEPHLFYIYMLLCWIFLSLFWVKNTNVEAIAIENSNIVQKPQYLSALSYPESLSLHIFTINQCEISSPIPSPKNARHTQIKVGQTRIKTAYNMQLSCSIISILS